MDWLTWALRMIGAAAMALFGITLLFAAATVKEGSAVVAGLGLAACGGAWFSWPRSPNAWRRDQPTQRQLNYAADLGIRVRRGATKGEVSDQISQATGR